LRVDLQLVIGDVHDPVSRNLVASVQLAHDASIVSERAVADLDDESGVCGSRMTIAILVLAPPDDAEIGLRLAFRKSDWQLNLSDPPSREMPGECDTGSPDALSMWRINLRLLRQVAFDQLDTVTRRQDPFGKHLLILRDGEAVELELSRLRR